VYKIQIDKKLKEFNAYIFFTSLINSNFYQELFFDHFSQISTGKHGPFLTENIAPSDFSEEKNKVFKEEFLQIVAFPKWGVQKFPKRLIKK